MSEPKPYTPDEWNDLPNVGGTPDLRRVRDTVEALERAERERDALRALVGQRCDGIECDHARERDALKATLRELADMAQGLDVSFFDHEEAMQAEAVLQRAREALGEVE